MEWPLCALSRHSKVESFTPKAVIRLKRVREFVKEHELQRLAKAWKDEQCGSARDRDADRRCSLSLGFASMGSIFRA